MVSGVSDVSRTWVVRAGKNGSHVDDFRASSVVAIGWSEVGELPADISDDALTALFDRVYASRKPGSRRVWQAQVWRFSNEIRPGDPVATYDPTQRIYLLGKVTGAVFWRGGILARAIPVQWTHQAARDGLSASTRNGLGSIATLFRASEDASRELWEKAVTFTGTASSGVVSSPSVDEPEDDTESLREDVAERADRFIEDRIAALDWRQMQELVAGILRGMGYQTTVAQDGPDRGVDIFASPDGLGLREPRIFVEVKHRSGAMGADQVRKFLGGRRPGDRCLYVSTGGFTKEARFEAERSNVPLTLVTLPMLRELLVQHYERMDSEARTLVPLQRLYWPLG